MAFGDAKNYGSITKPMRAHVVAMVATTDGKGYWIACSTGGVFNFGDALFYGSAKAAPPVSRRRRCGDARQRRLLARRCRRDRVQLRRRSAAADVLAGESHVARRGNRCHPRRNRSLDGERNGTVLNFGTATAHGPITGLLTGSHVTSIAAIWVPPPSTLAYDLAETDGKVAAIGGAAYYGSRFGKHLVAPIIELVSTPDRKGYWLIGADGSVYPFGMPARGWCRGQAAAGPGRGRRSDA